MGFQEFLVYSTITISFAGTLQLAVFHKDKNLLVTQLIMLLIGVLSYYLSYKAIQCIKNYTFKANLKGKDLNKRGQDSENKEIPESLGLAPATIFLTIATVCVLYQFYFQPELVLTHNVAILSTCYAVFLGFCDDVFDLKWRHKLWLPAVATIPVLVAYQGVTFIIVPTPLRFFLGYKIDLNVFYYIYMTALTIFCTNAINIYAGINGLEVGQSLIIAISIFVHNSIEIFHVFEEMPYNNEVYLHQHKFSLILIQLYIFVTLPLYYFNKFPSKVFVGDTFVYWSGMVFAVLGILGHFQKTLLLFFIPQILNFLYSIPQLIKLIPCPRHRLPLYDPKSNKLISVKSNLNLINLFLLIFGPMNEKTLCTVCIFFQIICSLFGFFIRYYAPTILY